MRWWLSFLIVLWVVPVQAQDRSLRKAVYACLMSAVAEDSFVELMDGSGKVTPQNEILLTCSGDVASVLFDRLEKVANQQVTESVPFTLRQAGKGIQCTRGPSVNNSCVIAISTTRGAVDAMR
jgi:hypothetical protein